MTDPRWKTVADVTPEGLRDATLELHWAVQLIASAGQTLAVPKADDSHRAMTWDRDLDSFVGQPLARAGSLRVGVRPADLTVHVLDPAGKALGSLPLSGVSLDDAYSWLGRELSTHSGATSSTLERPEYDMPDHPVARGAAFSSEHTDERRTLAALYGSAADLLAELISTHDDASVVRCWPHHFDIATLLTLERENHGKSVKTVGAGLAPMGGGYDVWYWYVTPWPYPEPDALPELRGPGSWHTEGWTGAVLTGTSLVDTDDAYREPAVRKFLDVSVEAALEALTG